MSSRTLIAALALLATASLSACSPTIAKPHLMHPGTAPRQRYNATQFDPYPSTDMGPEIVGGRPIDYMVPVPEVERANQFREQALPPVVPILAPGPGAPVYMPTSPPATIPGPAPTYPTPTYPAPTYPASSQPPVQYRY